ncbi:MAG TPA: acyl-CoA dehydrogenase family protein [Polyangia bacterium]|jgi:alkylation response protein AidB-like acyl-CoA dehydrogenase|nr:acyl-CoA dehydrogenase family protein [Polyangia bacterium]
MSFLKTERATLARFFPALDAELAARPFLELERADGPSLGIGLFRAAGGPSLLVPEALGGRGATPLDAVRIHRALGSRSPSLAVAATMHNFSLATLVEFHVFGGDEACAALLGAVAEQHLLMASGFAEGRPGANILAATMEARPTPDGGYVIRGSKKPCSLSRSMHLLSASALLIDGSGGPGRRAVVLVPADAPGIERRPFWRSSVLTAAESDEVVLHDVPIPGDLLFLPGAEDHLDPVELAGYLWFQLLIAASYLGMASGLVERVLAAGKGGATERALLGTELEAAMAALENVARVTQEAIDAQEAQQQAGEVRERLLAQALFVRYAVQGAIERATTLAAELLGGMAFIGSPEVVYLLGASRALAFHPPSRLSSAPALAGYLADEPLLAV